MIKVEKAWLRFIQVVSVNSPGRITWCQTLNRSYKNSKAVEEEGERFREAVVAVVVLCSRSRVVHVVRRRHIV